MTDKKFDPNNRGSAWKNDRRTEEWHAPYRGTAMIDGVEYYVDVYGKRADANERAPDITMKFKRKEKQPSKEADDGWGTAAVDEPNPAPPNEEIPFAPVDARWQN